MDNSDLTCIAIHGRLEIAESGMTFKELILASLERRPLHRSIACLLYDGRANLTTKLDDRLLNFFRSRLRSRCAGQADPDSSAGRLVDTSFNFEIATYPLILQQFTHRGVRAKRHLCVLVLKGGPLSQSFWRCGRTEMPNRPTCSLASEIYVLLKRQYPVMRSHSKLTLLVGRSS